MPTSAKSNALPEHPAAEHLQTWSPQGTRSRTRAQHPRKTAPLTVYGASIGLAYRHIDDLVQSMKAGFPVSTFEHLQAAMALSAGDLATTTNIALRTLTRRKREGRLHTDESERLYRLSALYDRSVQVLGDAETARHWFKTPKQALGGRSPLEYADTEPGAREVEDLLGRLEHGVFS